MSRAWDIFRNVNEFVRFSDTKAGVILAFAGGSAVFLATKVDILHTIIVAHRVDAWGCALYLVVFVYFAALLATIYCVLASIWPSLDGGEAKSLIYFKHIAEVYGSDHGAYGKALSALDDTAMEAQLAHQICINASIALRKFNWVGRAIRGLGIAMAAWAAMVFIILLLGGAATAP